MVARVPKNKIKETIESVIFFWSFIWFHCNKKIAPLYRETKSGIIRYNLRMSQIAIKSQIYNYQVIGDGDHTPILILHGWGRNGLEWIDIASECASWSKRKVYILDLPGFGGSSLPQVSNIFEYSELVVNFCQYLELNKVLLIGHSLGGRVGIVMAAKHGALLEKLILIDPAGVKPRSIRRLLLTTLSKTFALLPQILRRRLSEFVMDEDYKNSPSLRELYRSIVRDDLRNYLKRIEIETLIVWGEKDKVLPLSLVDVYRNFLPYPTISVIWEAGHDPHLEKPRELIRVLEAGWI